MRGGLPPDGGDDTAMNDDCGHDLDANYRYPSDVNVLGTANDGDGTVFTPALPCPECRGGPGGRSPERDGRRGGL